MSVRCSSPTVQALPSWEALGGAGEKRFQCKDAENCSWINGHKSGKKTTRVMVQISNLPYGNNRKIYSWKDWNWHKPQILWNNASSFFLSSVSTSFPRLLRPCQREADWGARTYTDLDFSMTAARSTAVLCAACVVQPPSKACGGQLMLASLSVARSCSARLPPLAGWVSTCEQCQVTAACQLTAGTQQAASRGLYVRSL